MEVHKVLGALIYIGLLALSLKFCRQNFLDYKEGKTSYTITQEYIGFADLPTICFCLSSEYRHGENFVASINVYSPNGYYPFKPLPLVVDRSVSTIFDLEFRLTLFQQIEATGQCYKISPQWKDNQRMNIDFTKFGLDLILNSTSHATKNVDSESVNIFVTSEKNSYGLAKRKWFDGNLNPNFKTWTGQMIRIAQVNEFRHLYKECTNDSYYECLAKRMRTFDLRNLFCGNLSVCAPGISLPAIEGYEMPSCPNTPGSSNNEFGCSNAALNRLMTDQWKHCKKSCIVKEFHLEIDSTFNLFQNEQYQKHYETKPFWAVRFEFDSPMTSSDSRLMQPFKTVNEEYLIISQFTLIGNVGGTIGMFVGFSLMGTSEWVMTLVFPKMLKLMKSVLKKCFQE